MVAPPPPALLLRNRHEAQGRLVRRPGMRDRIAHTGPRAQGMRCAPRASASAPKTTETLFLLRNNSSYCLTPTCGENSLGLPPHRLTRSKRANLNLGLTPTHYFRNLTDAEIFGLLQYHHGPIFRTKCV